MPAIRHPSPEAGALWLSLPLAGPVALPTLEPADGRDPVVILPSGALVCRGGSPVRVNGRAVPSGLRVLGEKDEIRLTGHRFFFTATEPVAVAPHEGEATVCPRCTERIEHGAEAVRCRCGTVFHQSADHPCFTYGETCPACGAATRLGESDWDPSTI